MRQFLMVVVSLCLGACSTKSGHQIMVENDRNTLSQLCVMSVNESAKRVVRCGFSDERRPSALAKQKGKRTNFSGIGFK
jgi:hypothetical protein